MMMRKLEPRFSLDGCTYGITKDKENTIRSTINSMGIAHSYTLETSLYGWRDQDSLIKHFNESDYVQIGKSLMQSIFLMEADPALTLRELGLTKDAIATELEKAAERRERE